MSENRTNRSENVTMTGEELQESGTKPEKAYRAVETGVVSAYKAVERGVVGAYKAVEQGAVGAWCKVEDTMVDKLFRREGETVEEAKARLSGKK